MTLKIDNYSLLTGDALTVLRRLPSESVQSVTTSPPYFLLRSYGTNPQIWDARTGCQHRWGDVIPGNSRGGSGPRSKSKRKRDDKSAYGRNAPRGRFCEECGAWEGELGLEPDPALFVKHLVDIFREVRRVLRKDGTLFLNIADTYVGEKYPKDHPWGLKQKDLYGIPHRLVEALQKDGWFYRNDAIWSKAGGNCPRCHYRLEKGSTKPEPVKDRFVRAHEYVFLLSKSKKYYFDDESVKESHTNAKRRDVFYITSANYSGAHYATMPLELAAISVLGGTSEGGACAKCRAPYKRVTRKGDHDREAQKRAGGNDDGEYHGKGVKDYSDHGAEDPSALKKRILAGMRKVETVGWEQTCKCESPGNPVPCIVMDPFSGSATTGAVALQHGRAYLGIELFEENNVNIAEPRLTQVLAERTPDEELEPLPLISEVYQGSALDLLRRVPAESVDLVLTDPPYNTSRKNNFHTMGRTGINFDWDGGFDQEKWLHYADRALKPGGNMVIWNDWKNLGFISDVLESMGYSVKRNCTWIKTNPFPRNIERSAVQKTEVGLWAVKPGGSWTFNKRADKPYEDLIFEYGVPRAKKGRPRHESKKPDGIFRELIQIFSNAGDLVLDPFAGGGTTAYAAEMEGRRHISFELSDEWYPETRAHWQDAIAETPALVHLARCADEEGEIVPTKT